MKSRKKAIILLSGGLDSTTCLALAASQGFDCYALSFDYHQRNKAELAAAKRVCRAFNVKHHHILQLDIYRWGGSALTDMSIDVPHETSQDIPATYVPARNTVYLSHALGWAEVLDARDIFIGVNAVDYSGYPDCRPEYIEAFTKMANLATRDGVNGIHTTIHTPLIHLSKADIIKLGTELDVDYALTLSCYDPDENGLACAQCAACLYRKKGFTEAQLADVTIYCEESLENE